MSSTKSAAQLAIGSGRISLATALEALPPPLVPSAEGSPEFTVTVINAAVNVALTRKSSHMLVLVTNATANPLFIIDLPGALEARPGDIVHFVGLTSGLGQISVRSSIIQGSTVNTVSGPYFSRVFVCIGNGSWAEAAGKDSVLSISATVSLVRSGSHRLVLVDSTSGNLTITLPAAASNVIGDQITFIKSVATANTVTIQRASPDLVDGVVSTTLFANLTPLTLLRTSNSSWTTLVGSTASVVVATDSVSLSGNTARDIRVLVQTSQAAWIAGTKQITLPSSTSLQAGSIVTVSDADGLAATSNITIPSLVSGVSNPTATGAYTIQSNFGSVTFINSANNVWTILSESSGLVDDYTSLSRVDHRVDFPPGSSVTATAQGRMRATPMFNWSHRKVAIHAEFTSLVTNLFPLEGFTAGGDLVLSEVPEAENVTAGTVGMVRCTVPAGPSAVGYMHWGSTPSSNVFQASQIAGFRAILRLQTANPGVDYNIAVGFGENLSLGALPAQSDQQLGSNGLYYTVNSGGSWRQIRRASNLANNTTTVAAVVGNRFVLEMYRRVDGTSTWDGYVNGVRATGNATNIPTVPLNFGLFIRNQGGVADYVVDVDSFTVFTLDMGVTRYT